MVQGQTSDIYRIKIGGKADKMCIRDSAAGNFVACAHRQTMGCSMDGGFTKYVRIPGRLLQMYPNCLYHIPDNLSFSEATLMDPAANGYNAVIQQAGFRSGEMCIRDRGSAAWMSAFAESRRLISAEN